MNYPALAAELANDPLERGYSQMSDADVVASLNTVDREVADSTPYTVREYLRRFGLSGVDAMRDAVAAASPTAIEALTDYGGNGGLDFSHANTVAAINELQTAGVLTAEQAANWKSLGKRTISRAQELALGQVKPGYVQKART